MFDYRLCLSPHTLLFAEDQGSDFLACLQACLEVLLFLDVLPFLECLVGCSSFVGDRCDIGNPDVKDRHPAVMPVSDDSFVPVVVISWSPACVFLFSYRSPFRWIFSSIDALLRRLICSFLFVLPAPFLLQLDPSVDSESVVDSCWGEGFGTEVPPFVCE